MLREIPIFTAFVIIFLGITVCYAAENEETPAELVGSWIDKRDREYVIKDDGGLIIPFKGDSVDSIVVHIDFSDDFIHLTAPIDIVPDEISDDFFLELIKLTGPVPMIKPSVDDEGLLYLAIDLPLAAMSEDEVILDIAFIVEFIDLHYPELHPWPEEE